MDVGSVPLLDSRVRARNYNASEACCRQGLETETGAAGGMNSSEIRRGEFLRMR
jgi:hypothetical protein